MLKALIDTNVMVDAFASREPFCKEAEEILLLAAERKFSGFVTGSNLTDIYYLLGKELSPARALTAVKTILKIVGVIPVGQDECVDASESGLPDFEDAVVAVCAARVKADCIVSRDRAFARSGVSVPVLTPAKFLARLKHP